VLINSRTLTTQQGGDRKMKKQNKTDKLKRCPECNKNSIRTDYRHGEIFCSHCGLVIEEGIIDERPTWKDNRGGTIQKEHKVAPITLLRYDKGLSTAIGIKDIDHSREPIPYQNRVQVYRLRKLKSITKMGNSTEKNVVVALQEIDKTAFVMGLSKTVKETASSIYRKAATKNLIKERGIEVVSMSALYAACRQCDSPRTLDEIAKTANLPRQEIGRTYKFITKKIGLSLKPVPPQNFVNRFCGDLELSNEVAQKAFKLIEKTESMKLNCGKGPGSIVGTSIYIASILCNEKKTQREICEVAGITEVTVRNTLRTWKEVLELEKLNI